MNVFSFLIVLLVQVKVQEKDSDLSKDIVVDFTER